MSCGIYKITNNVNKKIYVGKSINIKRRWREHRSCYLKPDKDCYLYRAMRKYGIDNFTFEIIEECSEDDNLNEKERYWIEYYNSFKNGYNETQGGEGKNIFSPIKIQELWDNGYSIIEIAQQLSCNELTVRKNLKEYKNYSIEESSKRKRERIIKNKIMSNAAKKSWGQKIYQYSLDGEYLAEYDSLKDAANSCGLVSGSNIRLAANGERQSAGGFLWSLEKLDKIPAISKYNKNCIKVKNIETGKIFNCLSEAATWSKSQTWDISKNCRKERSFAGYNPETHEKLTWEFI